MMKTQIKSEKRKTAQIFDPKTGQKDVRTFEKESPSELKS